jgi:hypothetical protein
VWDLQRNEGRSKEKEKRRKAPNCTEKKRNKKTAWKNSFLHKEEKSKFYAIYSSDAAGLQGFVLNIQFLFLFIFLCLFIYTLSCILIL